MDNLEKFSVKSSLDLERRYTHAKNQGHRGQIIPSELPVPLHILLPYLDYFVVDDQVERESFMKFGPLIAFQDLAKLITLLDDQLDDWLGGKQARVRPISNTYIAVSILREMAEEYDIYRRDKNNR